MRGSHGAISLWHCAYTCDLNAKTVRQVRVIRNGKEEGASLSIRAGPRVHRNQVREHSRSHIAVVCLIVSGALRSTATLAFSRAQVASLEVAHAVTALKNERLEQRT